MSDKKGKKAKSGGFQSLGLSAHIIGGILKMGYKVPTPIQRKALPLALAGRDLVAMARTGEIRPPPSRSHPPLRVRVNEDAVRKDCRRAAGA